MPHTQFADVSRVSRHVSQASRKPSLTFHGRCADVLRVSRHVASHRIRSCFAQFADRSLGQVDLAESKVGAGGSCRVRGGGSCGSRRARGWAWGSWILQGQTKAGAGGSCRARGRGSRILPGERWGQVDLARGERWGQVDLAGSHSQLGAGGSCQVKGKGRY